MTCSRTKCNAGTNKLVELVRGNGRGFIQSFFLFSCVFGGRVRLGCFMHCPAAFDVAVHGYLFPLLDASLRFHLCMNVCMVGNYVVMF